MIALLLGWLGNRLAAPIAAGAALLLALGLAVQTARIEGWPLIGGGYKDKIAALQAKVDGDAAAWTQFRAQAQRQVAAAQKKAREAGAAAAAEQARSLAASAGLQARIQQKVPVYVSDQSDAACVVPWGAVRLLDAAASGTDPGVAAALIAPGQPDGAASTVALSDLVALLAQDLGIARDNDGQLTQLEKAVAGAGQ